MEAVLPGEAWDPDVDRLLTGMSWLPQKFSAPS
jgi:hypothetical protein